jgi:hypothetical protein
MYALYYLCWCKFEAPIFGFWRLVRVAFLSICSVVLVQMHDHRSRAMLGPDFTQLTAVLTSVVGCFTNIRPGR